MSEQPQGQATQPLTRDRAIEMLNNFANGQYMTISRETCASAARFLQQPATEISGDTAIETRRAIRYAIEELRSLRQQNAILSAKVEVVDVFNRALRPSNPGGVLAEDTQWLLQRALDRLDAPAKAAAETLRGETSGAQAGSATPPPNG